MVIDLETPLERFSKDCQRHRRAALREYLAWVQGIDQAHIDLGAMPKAVAVKAVNLTTLQVYANRQKAAGARQAYFQQLRQAVLYLAEQLADLRCIEYTALERLRHFAYPKVSGGHRAGIWLTREQVSKLITLTEQQAGVSEARRSRDAAILALFVIGGLRCEEMTKLCWKDIGEAGPYVRLCVHGKGRKRRYLKLPETVQARLLRLKAYHPDPSPSSPLFFAFAKTKATKKGLGIRGLFAVVKQAGQRLGVPGLAPHDLRRSSARLAYEAGTPLPLIQQHLGHAQLSTTEHYINPLLLLDHAATDTLAAALADSFTDDEDDGLPETEPSTSLAPAPVHANWLTRQEAAHYLNLSVPQFDRLRKKAGLVPVEKKAGKTRRLALYDRETVDALPNPTAAIGDNARETA